ncbi:antiviral reverse transcriptase Drt3b [Spongiivirga citrea]|uniref:Reverse transcriptase n=1 Tax=Spongiivirga citrea TaxID=1481457 RepID=A0A6M0CKS8_9FLAO|nr:antiviral reverse transcriptase Drt3b [Spongiivirga citrea]NER16584.1 reverse transcriptase [Spongiivirga citrea]
MKKIRQGIGYKKERVVLSDVLPYEVPPFFSNRHFYDFLTRNNIELIDKPNGAEIRFKNNRSKTLERIIKIVFGINFTKQVQYNDGNNYRYITLRPEDLQKIPFKFRISHKNKDYRELTVVHPINQLLLVSFYESYKNTMLYYCDKSKYSLRKPSKIASLKYFKDSTFKKHRVKNPEIEIIETNDMEYKALKTFFSYQKYSNIYKFYESNSFHKAEKGFDKLLKFDISRCFDSIYTHSLSWALTNKNIVKENLGTNKNTFGGVFDKLMQLMNYNETNGIVIGPEFSRIFAELILQQVDESVEKELKYKYKVEYDIYRYVDDYFVFFSKDKVKDEILTLYKLKLKEYNLFFNDSKTEEYSKPIITRITIAKENIRELIENTIIFKFLENDDLPPTGIKYYESRDVITNYKKILAATKTSYKDLQNYFLATIFNKTKQLIGKFQSEERILINHLLEESELKEELLIPELSDDKKNKISEDLFTLKKDIDLEKKKIVKYQKQLVKKFLEIINLTFFVYSVLPRVSYSIKVCHILFRIIDFVKNQEKTRNSLCQKPRYEFILKNIDIGFSFDDKHTIFKTIYDGINIVLNKNRATVHSEIETLYLLPILNELGKNYELSEKTIKIHFKEEIEQNMSYFLIISLLHHIQRKDKYDGLRNILKEKIRKKFTKFESRKTEDTLLLIDILTCPYVGSNDQEVKEFRKEVLELIKFFEPSISNTEKESIIDDISIFQNNWFAKWEGSDLGKELNTKRGHNVY